MANRNLTIIKNEIKYKLKNIKKDLNVCVYVLILIIVSNKIKKWI